MNRRRRLTYPIRRFGWWLRSPRGACDARWCAAERVGFSHWCRHHTDRILHEHVPHETIEAWRDGSAE